MPVPETKRAKLRSAGFEGETCFTAHTYAETRGPITVAGERGYEFIFVCTETLARRRYGFVRVAGEADSPVEPGEDERPRLAQEDRATPRQVRADARRAANDATREDIEDDLGKYVPDSLRQEMSE